MKKITKALFPIAGMGTRLLPATKAIPKELLPVYDRPILEVLVEEVVDAGIEEIVFVTSRKKSALENHFDAYPELEQKLEEEGKTELLEKIRKFKDIKFTYVRQAEPKGDGHAILCAEHLFGDEPFLVIFGDELLFGSPSSIDQLLGAYAQTQASVIGVRHVPTAEISSYGVVAPLVAAEQEGIFPIQGVVEKPRPEEAPSNFAVIGKYVCTPEVWDALKKAKKSVNGETRLIDGFAEILAEGGPLYAAELKGSRFDTGNPKGLFFANLYSALQNGVSKAEITAFLEH
ncbi:MAG: UTP--glucose-1-phosphate uridylyltransferase [Candidatus Peregrinibacteria bacterium]